MNERDLKRMMNGLKDESLVLKCVEMGPSALFEEECAKVARSSVRINPGRNQHREMTARREQGMRCLQEHAIGVRFPSTLAREGVHGVTERGACDVAESS